MHVPVSERFTVDADANRLEAALLQVFYSSASCTFFLNDVLPISPLQILRDSLTYKPGGCPHASAVFARLYSQFLAFFQSLMSPVADCLLTGEERMWSHVIWRHAMAGSENGNLRFVIQSMKV